MQCAAIVEGIFSDRFERGGEGKLTQRRATGEGTGTDGLQSLLESDALQRRAAAESVFADFGQGIVQRDALQRRATVEGVFADCGATGRQCDRGDGFVVLKSAFPDFGEGQGEGQLGHTLRDEEHFGGFFIEKQVAEGRVNGVPFGHGEGFQTAAESRKVHFGNESGDLKSGEGGKRVVGKSGDGIFPDADFCLFRQRTGVGVFKAGDDQFFVLQAQDVIAHLGGGADAGLIIIGGEEVVGAGYLIPLGIGRDPPFAVDFEFAGLFLGEHEVPDAGDGGGDGHISKALGVEEEFFGQLGKAGLQHHARDRQPGEGGGGEQDAVAKNLGGHAQIAVRMVFLQPEREAEKIVSVGHTVFLPFCAGELKQVGVKRQFGGLGTERFGRSGEKFLYATGVGREEIVLAGLIEVPVVVAQEIALRNLFKERGKIHVVALQEADVIQGIDLIIKLIEPVAFRVFFGGLDGHFHLQIGHAAQYQIIVAGGLIVFVEHTDIIILFGVAQRRGEDGDLPRAFFPALCGLVNDGGIAGFFHLEVFSERGVYLFVVFRQGYFGQQVFAVVPGAFFTVKSLQRNEVVLVAQRKDFIALAQGDQRIFPAPERHILIALFALDLNLLALVDRDGHGVAAVGEFGSLWQIGKGKGGLFLGDLEFALAVRQRQGQHIFAGHLQLAEGNEAVLRDADRSQARGVREGAVRGIGLVAIAAKAVFVVMRHTGEREPGGVCFLLPGGVQKVLVATVAVIVGFDAFFFTGRGDLVHGREGVRVRVAGAAAGAGAPLSGAARRGILSAAGGQRKRQQKQRKNKTQRAQEEMFFHSDSPFWVWIASIISQAVPIKCESVKFFEKILTERDFFDIMAKETVKRRGRK